MPILWHPPFITWFPCDHDDRLSILWKSLASMLHQRQSPRSWWVAGQQRAGGAVPAQAGWQMGWQHCLLGNRLLIYREPGTHALTGVPSPLGGYSIISLKQEPHNPWGDRPHRDTHMICCGQEGWGQPSSVFLFSFPLLKSRSHIVSCFPFKAKVAIHDLDKAIIENWTGCI